jgi:hypothetical protein
MTWSALASCQAPLWLPTIGSLRSALEAAARNAYLARKDPADAAALYCALGRYQV